MMQLTTNSINQSGLTEEELQRFRKEGAIYQIHIIDKEHPTPLSYSNNERYRWSNERLPPEPVTDYSFKTEFTQHIPSN